MPADKPRPPAATIDFAAVVNDHWKPVFRLALTLCGNVHAAEDLTQETFVRALDRIGNFEAGTNMRGWLLRIATNAFFDEQRRKKRARMQPLSHEPPANQAEPGWQIETAEQAALVRTAMQELSELTRVVFHLRVQEDLSFREIAEITGSTEQSARWHMHHARTKLLECLE